MNESCSFKKFAKKKFALKNEKLLNIERKIFVYFGLIEREAKIAYVRSEDYAAENLRTNALQLNE